MTEEEKIRLFTDYCARLGWSVVSAQPNPKEPQPDGITISRPLPGIFSKYTRRKRFSSLHDALYWLFCEITGKTKPPIVWGANSAFTRDEVLKIYVALYS